MSTIPSDMFKSMICSISNDNHIINLPILLPCGGNVCRQCLIEDLNENLKCFYCNQEHEKKELLSILPHNPIVEELIKKTYWNEIVEELKTKFEALYRLIQEEKLDEEIDLRINIAENDIDIRIESIIDELHKLREEFKSKLDKIKKKLRKSRLNDDLRVIRQEIEVGSMIDHLNFYEKQEILRKYQLKLKEYETEIKQIGLIANESPVGAQLIGQLSQPFIEFKKTKDFKDIQVRVDEINGIYHLRKENKIILKDCNQLKLFDMKWNALKTIDSLSDDFSSLGCICLDSEDRLYVEDFPQSKILVFNSDLSLIKDIEVALVNEPSAMLVDSNSSSNVEGVLYISDSIMHQILAISIETGKHKKTIKIDSPREMVANEDHLYVLSHTGYEKGKEFTRIKFGSNCIFVLGKVEYTIQHKITFKNWLCPYGLHLDTYSNLITTALEFDDRNIISSNRLVFTIDTNNNELLHKTAALSIKYTNIMFIKSTLVNWSSRFIRTIYFN